MSTISPFAQPMYVMLKPVGSTCNLACTYCYYLEKSHLYAASPRREMSEDLLERFIEQYIASQTTSEVLFTWHGGEALVRPLTFYKKALALQRKYARGRTISNTIQTNGTLLDDEWCAFFKENNWLVGVSIDGPREMHDRYRLTRGGGPSFDAVMRGVELLDKHGVEWNALAVVNDFNVRRPLEFYRFFKAIGCRYIQFTPVVERIVTGTEGRQLAAADEADEAVLAPFSVTPDLWGEFLCAIFDEWVRCDVGRYYIQIFDATLALWVGVAPGVCSMAPTCGHAGMMEFNGDIYSCDHFAFPQYKLGNILVTPLARMMYGQKQQRFGQAKRDSLPAQCRQCSFLFACNGECPKNRFARTADGEAGLNYLCGGYRRFFEHVAPCMEFMKREYMAQRPPAGVMEALRRGLIAGFFKTPPQATSTCRPW